MGTKLQRLRNQCHLTQEQVAEMLNCTREKISRYESDLVKRPNCYFVCSLAKLYNVNCDYFCPAKESPDEKK